MAYKKRQPKPETESKTVGGVAEYPAFTVVLNDADFGTFIRLVKGATLAAAIGMKAAIDPQLRRLRLRVKGTEPVAGMPEGSSQCDVGSMVSWAASVTRADQPAKLQLLKLAATINARVN